MFIDKETFINESYFGYIVVDGYIHQKRQKLGDFMYSGNVIDF